MPKCEYKRCKLESEVYYEGHHICNKHWCEMCDKEIDLDKYFKVKKTEQKLTLGLNNWI